ncbi:MAG TPA: GntR family transcriptional regulator [Planctomycetota bacterium]|nr:GntR family transcriptional regulator [Planctomycetota bacterium]
MTKKEQAYQQLRGQLLHRSILPGERLREIPLSKKLGVSRIPLREAIDQLAGDGLVERVPGLGSYVRACSPQDLREIYQMREVLECFTVEKAAEGMTGAQMGQLVDLCEEISAALGEYRRTGKWTWTLRDRLVAADAAFHQTIAQAAGNEQIRKELSRLHTVSELLSYRPEYAADELESMTRSASEHLGILAALRRSDAKAARDRITRHIRHACERALLVAQAASRLPGGALPAKPATPFKGERP